MENKMKIAVAGTGYVGLVAGVCFAEKGHNVSCVDVDAQKVKLMESGVTPIYEEGLEELMQKKAKVALDEGYIFGDEGRGFERINVASPRSVIEECMNRIRTAFEEEKLV